MGNNNTPKETNKTEYSNEVLAKYFAKRIGIWQTVTFFLSSTLLVGAMAFIDYANGNIPDAKENVGLVETFGTYTLTGILTIAAIWLTGRFTVRMEEKNLKRFDLPRLSKRD